MVPLPPSFRKAERVASAHNKTATTNTVRKSRDQGRTFHFPSPGVQYVSTNNLLVIVCGPQDGDLGRWSRRRSTCWWHRASVDGARGWPGETWETAPEEILQSSPTSSWLACTGVFYNYLPTQYAPWSFNCHRPVATTGQRRKLQDRLCICCHRDSPVF